MSLSFSLENNPTKSCPVCGDPAPKSCQGCQRVSYCSVAHQKTDWKQGHRTQCTPYILKESSQFGRHLVAARNLKPGTVLTHESPIICGPRSTVIGGGERVVEDGSSWGQEGQQEAQTSNYPEITHCLSCCKPLSVKTMCSKCKWPTCGNSCSKAKPHLDECKYFVKLKVKYKPSLSSTSTNQQLQLSESFVLRGILILRGLLKSQNDENSWRKLTNLQDTRADGSSTFVLNPSKVLKLRHIFKARNFGTDEEWSRLNQILEINAFSIDRAEAQNEEPSQVTALYAITSLFAHSCAPNCSLSIGYSPEFNARVRVASAITKGEPLTLCYNNQWLHFGSPERRAMISLGAGFNCQCPRCSDSTEVGTFMSAIKCKCSSGYLLPVRTFAPGIEWRCTDKSCSGHLDNPGMVKRAEQELTHLAQTCTEVPIPSLFMELFDEFIQKYSGVILHPSHWVLVHASRAVVNFLGPRLQYMDSGELDNFALHAQKLLKVYDCTAPGISLDRALIQMFLSRAYYYSVFHHGDSEDERLEKNGQHISSFSMSLDKKFETLQWIYDLQKESLQYWKEDIQTKPLNKDIGFEGSVLEEEMLRTLRRISEISSSK